MHPTLTHGCKDPPCLVISSCSLIIRLIASLACFAQMAAVIVNTSCAAPFLDSRATPFCRSRCLIPDQRTMLRKTLLDDRQAFPANL